MFYILFHIKNIEIFISTTNRRIGIEIAKRKSKLYKQKAVHYVRYWMVFAAKLSSDSLETIFYFIAHEQF